MPHPTVGQIIRQRREAMNLTLDVLAKEVGATKSYLSMIENHKVANPPSREILRALERALAIGQGELQRVADWQLTPEDVRKEVERLSLSARAGQELAQWIVQNTARRKEGGRNLDQVFHSGELADKVRQALAKPTEQPGRPALGPALDPYVGVRCQVPLINKVAAGYPKGFTDLDYPARVADDAIFVPDLADPDAFAARVVGESMMPDYRAGDVVVFSPAAPVDEGSDCFVRILPDNETTFKRVFFDKRPGKGRELVRLQPINPKFPPMTYERTRIAGLYRAVARLQKLV